MLAIWAQPGARRTESVAIIENRLKIRLAAPPVDGKANDALVSWLSERLGVPQRAMRLASGQTSRHKRVFVASELPAETIAERLLPKA